MNKICINGYLNHLKEVQAIHDYKVGYKLNQPDSDCFTVYFIKDTKARQDKLSSESDIDNTPLLKSIKTEVKEAKTHLPFAYDFLDAVLVRHGHEGYKDEVIKLFQQHDYNGDVFKSNLLRSLTKYDKNAGSFLGYLANSLKEDWAREDRIQEEAQQQAEQKILEAEQQNKQAETERQEAYQKEMQEFRKYFDSLPVAERERLWQQAESKVTFAPHNEELKKMVIFEEVKELVQAAKEAIPA